MVSDSISHFREASLSENRRTIAHSIAAPTGVWRTLFPRLLILLSELFTTRSSGRPIRFLRIVTPTGRGKTAHAVNAHALIVANVDSHVRWKLFLLCLIFYVHQLFDRSKLSILTRKFIGSMVPWVQENFKVPFPWYRKVAPVLEFPFPAERSTLLEFVTWNYASDCIVQVHVNSTVHLRLLCRDWSLPSYQHNWTVWNPRCIARYCYANQTVSPLKIQWSVQFVLARAYSW